MMDRARASAILLLTGLTTLGWPVVNPVNAQATFPSSSVPARAAKPKPFVEAVRINPAMRAEAMRRGDVSVRQGEMVAAAQSYLQAALAAPSDPLPRIAAGITLAEQGRLADATDQFRKAVEFAEDDPVAALLLSSSLEGSGFGSDAQQIYLDTKRRFGRRAGNSFDTSNSVARLTAANKQFPNSPVFCLLLGDAYNLAGQWSQADEAYIRATKLAPLWAKPLVNLGISRDAQGNSAKAIATFERALALDPKNKRVQLLKADAQLKSGRNRSALLGYQQVAAARGVAPALRVQAETGIGQALAYEQKPDAAVVQLNQAQQLAPRDPTPSAVLGEFLNKNGDYQGAADAYGTALGITRNGGLFAGRSALYRSTAEAQLSARQPRKALSTTRQALVDEPANAALWHRLAAQAYFQQKDTGMATEELRAALESENGPYPLDTLRAIDASGVLKAFKESYAQQLGAAETGFFSRKTESGISISSAAADAKRPENRVRALAALANIARYQNDVREEIRLREQLTQLRPNNGWDWFLLAEIYDRRAGEPANARAAYSKSLEVDGLNDAARKWASDRNSALTAPLYRPK
jgi:tetratricopeptide (TPR) repeat protein